MYIYIAGGYMSKERYFSRIKFKATAQIEFDGKEYHAELLDISIKGALFNSEIHSAAKIGDICNINIHLPSSDISLTINAELVHLHKINVGFKFTGIDTDTLTHLRRLIELNTGNSEKTAQELSFWLK